MSPPLNYLGRPTPLRRCWNHREAPAFRHGEAHPRGVCAAGKTRRRCPYATWMATGHDELSVGYNSESLHRAVCRSSALCQAMAARLGFLLCLCGSQWGEHRQGRTYECGAPYWQGLWSCYAGASRQPGLTGPSRRGSGAMPRVHCGAGDLSGPPLGTLSAGHRARRLGAGGACRRADSQKKIRPPFSP